MGAAWISIASLLIFLALYAAWAHGGAAGRRWMLGSLYAGMGVSAAVFMVAAWQLLTSATPRHFGDSVLGDVVAGQVSWEKRRCTDCHALGGEGAEYGPNLTLAWARFVERADGDEALAGQSLVRFLQAPPPRASGRKAMPDHGIEPQEAQQIAAFLHWASHMDFRPSSSGRRAWQEEPPDAAPGREMEAGRKAMDELGCLSCHSIGDGAMVGPDLKLAAGKYDRATLLTWVKDPEAVYRARGKRPLNSGFGEMPALGVPAEQASAIVAYLQQVGGRPAAE